MYLLNKLGNPSEGYSNGQTLGLSLPQVPPFMEMILGNLQNCPTKVYLGINGNYHSASHKHTKAG